jgi:hypothetical protein
MTRRLLATDMELAQMNLPLEREPLMLPEDKRRELTSALADLLLGVAVDLETAKQGQPR